MKNIQIILNAILSKNIFEYILIDRDLKVVNASTTMHTYLDRDPKNGDDVRDLLPELVGAEEEIGKVFNDPGLNFMLDSVHKNDFYVNLSIEYYDPKHLLVLLHNITEVTLSKQKVLQYSNESILLNNTLQKILDSQNVLLFVTSHNEIVYTNEQFMEYFKVPDMKDVRRKNLQIYKYYESSLTSYDALFEYVSDNEEYIVIDNDTFILKAVNLESTHKLFTLTKVTKLSKEIYIDPLTNIYKKQYFNTCLEKLIQEKDEGVLVVLDIDDFKQINDTYGHQVGDNILVEFTELIKENIRGEDLFARWGGEEFLLLLYHTNVENALKKVEQLRALVDGHAFNVVDHLTSSFGVSKKQDDDTLSTLLNRADTALYKAKKSGKNRVVSL
jgi:two-component system cell cycle response regulator